MQGRLTNSEKTIERLLVDLVKMNGGLCIKLMPTFMSGLPDRMVLMPHKQVYFVETKSTGDNARKLQKSVHKMLNKLGFEVFIIDSVLKVREFIIRAKNDQLNCQMF